MGKIADRLAQKSHPLYAKSKQLFKDYRRYWELVDAVPQDEDGDMEADSEEYDRAQGHLSAVTKRLDEILRTSSGPDFTKWVDLLSLHSDAIADSGDVLSRLMDDWSEVAAVTPPGSKQLPGVLVALPLRVEGKKLAWHVNIPSEKQEQITQILQKYEFLGDEGQISYMPRLLSVNEAMFLDYRSLYHIRQAFLKGNPREAYRLMLEQRMAVGAGLPDLSNPSGEDNYTVGLLVGYARCPDLDEVLPVDNQLMAAENEAQLAAELHDIEVIAKQMGTELSALLEVDSLAPTQQLATIYKSRSDTAQEERRHYFMAQLADNEWEPADVTYLRVSPSFKIPERGRDRVIEVLVRDTRECAPSTAIEWILLHGESLEHAMSALLFMFSVLGLDVDAEATA